MPVRRTRRDEPDGLPEIQHPSAALIHLEGDAEPEETEGLYLREGSSAVAAVLRTRGIELERWARRPGKEPPEIPADVTGLADPALMQLFTSLSRWTRYLAVQLAAAQVDESYAARQAAIAKAAKTPLAELGDAHEQAKSYHVMIKALYGVTDRDFKLISREITRRTGRGAQEGRGNKAEEDE